MLTIYNLLERQVHVLLVLIEILILYLSYFVPRGFPWNVF